MSNRWVNWAWEQECRDPSAKLVLVCLADHAGHDGIAWPGTSRLGEMTGLSSRTIRRWLDEFEAVGLISRVRRRRKDGTLGTYEYQLVQRTPVSTGHERPVDAGDNDKRTSVSGSPADMHVRAEPPVTEPPVEPECQASPDATRLADMFADLLAERGARRPTVTKAWIVEMDRLMRIDGRSSDEVERVLRWLCNGNDEVASFWRPNVRSPEKLRMKWDQMKEQVVARRAKRGVSSTLSALNEYLEGSV